MSRADHYGHSSGAACTKPCTSCRKNHAQCRPSDSKNAEVGCGNRGVVCGADAEADGHSSVGRIVDSVVPETCGAIVGAAFLLIGIEDRLFEGFLFFGAQLLPTVESH